MISESSQRELREIFRRELADLAREYGRAARALRESHQGSRRALAPEGWDSLVGVTHTLKGAARSAGFPELTRLAQLLHGLLLRAASGETSLDAEQLRILEEIGRSFARCVDALERDRPEAVADEARSWLPVLQSWSSAGPEAAVGPEQLGLALRALTTAAASGDDPAGGGLDEPRTTAPPPHAVDAPSRVLVADDSPTVRHFLTDLLESDPDLEVIATASTGMETLEQARAHLPDVVVLDVSMPLMDGIEAARRISEELPIPVVLISAVLEQDEIRERAAAQELGAVAVLPKPGTRPDGAFEEEAHELVEKVKSMARLPSLPRSKPPRPPERRELRAADAGRPAALAGRRILVVEDSPTQARELASLLTQQGARAEVAPDAGAAWRRIRVETFDLVLSDVILPGGSGYELCQVIRSCTSTMALPVVLVTGKSTAQDMLRGLSAGAEDFIVKPFGARDLTRRLLRAMEAGRAEPGGEDLPELRLDVEGDTFWIQADRSKILRYLLSAFEGAMGAQQRIQEVRLSAQAARHSERWMAALFQGLPDPMVVLDLSGTIRLTNDAWTALLQELGLDPEGYGSGASYWSVCKAAWRRESAPIADTLLGIRREGGPSRDHRVADLTLDALGTLSIRARRVLHEGETWLLLMHRVEPPREEARRPADAPARRVEAEAPVGRSSGHGEDPAPDPPLPEGDDPDRREAEE